MRKLKTLACAIALSSLFMTGGLLTSQSAAHASVNRVGIEEVGGPGSGGSGNAVNTPLRLKAMHSAHRQKGKWYCWGGTGPSCFDCSGLVYKAYLDHGVNIGRTTYDMLSNRHLRWESSARAMRGDLAFFGSGHVELVWQRKWARTFGAHHTGTRIGQRKWSSGWHPTAFYRIVR